MNVTAEYDREADALYVRLGAGERARTVEVDDTTYVDVDVDGRPIGIELLYPSLGLRLDLVAQRFQLHQQLPVIAASIARAGAPGVSAPTVTGGTRLASTTITTMVIEGTVGAARDTGEASVAHAEPPIRIPA